ncbi:trypsin-like peptidase domain-containing protein [Mesobacillus maritimus]|uniref:S1C family serine protease n=1 Tax=Mesobacillus maritimus TaxID=1643336 RepID=UPI002042303C|nr:trypsin-like peptidase domain-containing protein [Mesobacillus maritimus]MCM3671189.1 trypsin-like peptidase domain-containing protein [Mesobacillus maritimus]
MSDLYKPFDEQTTHSQNEEPIKPNPFEQTENPKQKPRKSAGFKSFLSMITAGVMGSALTLGAVTYKDSFDFLKGKPNADTNEYLNADELAASIVPTSNAGNTTVSLADIAEDASKAIVGIVNYQNQSNPFSGAQGTVQSGSGSGVIFKVDGNNAFIVTNNHVIEGATEVEISLYNGEKVKAEVVGADALTDLAVLKIDEKYATHTLEFGDSSGLRPGDQVMAIGNPLGLDLSRTVTQGIVSAIDREIAVETSAGEWELSVIQTDAAINPGNSGGALINTSGHVIGINSLKISDNGVEGLGFAIPSNDVVPIINELIENGKVERPYLGVSLTDLQEIPSVYLQSLPENVTDGTMVSYVEPNSAAAKAGLKQMDVIVAIDHDVVDNSSDLRKYMYSHLSEGDTATLKVYREGKEIEVDVNLDQSNSNTN